MSRAKVRSISLPIVLSTITVLLTIALLVGWTLVIVQNITLTRTVSTWLLVSGIASFVVIMSVVVMFSVFLVREILEVRRQETFIDSVTHELKSPLASIKLCLDTLARAELSATQRESLRHMMLADVDRLSIFVDDILQASRISHGRTPQQWAAVSVNALLQRCVDNIRRRYEIDASVIETEVPENLTIHTDPTALETVLKNLLDNAVKYSTQPAHVRVEVRNDGKEHLSIAVSDLGIGIDKPHLKRIFRRFYRIPSDEVYNRSGTGLGLYVVAALVRDLGGSVQASSAGLDRGTSIRVRLPTGNAA